MKIKARVFEFFNTGIGWRITALLVDMRFLGWKLIHPKASFSDFYAESIASMLRRGGSHKTLGNKKFLSRSLSTPSMHMNPLEYQARGTEYFDLAIKYGLKPYHTCVDYGCGSLRVGQHFIGYLQSEKYLGLDIVSDFYEIGKALIPASIFKEKKPRFSTINPTTIKIVLLQQPDFVFSFAVLKHVSPRELDVFFNRIVNMMSSHTLAVITFNQAEQTIRAGAKIWDFCEKDIFSSIYKQCEGLNCSIVPFGTDKTLPRVAVLLIRKQSIQE